MLQAFFMADEGTRLARGDERAVDQLKRIQAKMDGVKLEQDNAVSQAEDEKT